MTLKNLPIGIQTLSKIIEGNYAYVDKTAIAYELINKYQYAFLSRPRRFGKSLFVDTLHQLFEGNQALFEELAIYDKWDWRAKYPVIRIDFTEGKLLSMQALDDKLEEIFKSNQKRLGLKCSYAAHDRRCFSELVRLAHEKYNQKVVILVDEYDKPILDNITDVDLADTIRSKLYDIYSVMKGSDRHIHFAFLTGVTKLTKTSVFSGLNNIVDISLDAEFGDICGYTQRDLETTFAQHLAGADMSLVKEWYNGYNFLASPMYNPFDVLQFIAKGFQFRNYWFESGTPSFLIKMLAKNNYYIPDLSNIIANEALLNSFDIKDLNFETLLFQSGYLTIEKQYTNLMGELEYQLKIPNREVQSALNNYILDKLYDDKKIAINRNALFSALHNSHIDDFITALKTIFASIPYNSYANTSLAKFEAHYASIIYVYLQSLGLNIIAEDVTNRGRIDLTVLMPNNIYILEFKMAKSNEDPIKQIKERDYPQKYLSHNKPIHLVGVVFDEQEKNVARYESALYERR